MSRKREVLRADWVPTSRETYARDYYIERREELKAAARRRYHENPEKERVRYQQKRDKRLQQQRDKRAGSTGVSMQADQRARYAENPAPAIARAHKRRALQQSAGVGTDRKAYAAFVAEVRTAERYACHWCKRGTPRCDRTVDHVIPISRGGADSVENLCCACRMCNARKGDKMPSEWLA